MEAAKNVYIDCDTHFFPIKMLERVADPAKGHIEVSGGVANYHRNGKLLRSFKEPRWDLEKRYPWMQRDGFDVQVLIPDNPQLVYEMEPALGVEMARAYNDTVAEEVGKHKGFIGVSWVYLPEVSEAVRELRRAADMGLHAVKVMGKYQDVNLDSQALWPFYEEAARLDIPILVHPVAALGSELVRPLFAGDGMNEGPWGTEEFRRSSGSFNGGLGLTFMYMAIITRLVCSGTLDRFPTLRFGFFEGGVGWVPFLRNRMDNLVSRGQEDEQNPRLGKGPEGLQRMPSAYFDQLYVAAVSWETYLPHIVEMWPDHNIMIGSDFNHGDQIATWPNTVAPLKAMSGLTVEDRDKILGGNAERFFGYDRHPERRPASALPA